MDKNLLYNLIYAALMVIITIINILFNKSKLKAKNKELSTIIKDTAEEIKNKTKEINDSHIINNIVEDYIPSAMKEAEETGMTGVAKKTLVISNVVIKLAELGLSYTPYSDLVSSTIEKLINFSKSINKRRESNNGIEEVNESKKEEVNEICGSTQEACSGNDDSGNGADSIGAVCENK